MSNEPLSKRQKRFTSRIHELEENVKSLNEKVDYLMDVIQKNGIPFKKKYIPKYREKKRKFTYTDKASHREFKREKTSPVEPDYELKHFNKYRDEELDEKERALIESDTSDESE